MIMTDARLKGLAAELDAGVIARREFLRKSTSQFVPHMLFD